MQKSCNFCVFHLNKQHTPIEYSDTKNKFHINKHIIKKICCFYGYVCFMISHNSFDDGYMSDAEEMQTEKTA